MYFNKKDLYLDYLCSNIYLKAYKGPNKYYKVHFSQDNE